MRCNLSQLLVQKITKRIYSSKPALLNCPTTKHSHLRKNLESWRRNKMVPTDTSRQRPKQNDCFLPHEEREHHPYHIKVWVLFCSFFKSSCSKLRALQLWCRQDLDEMNKHNQCQLLTCSLHAEEGGTAQNALFYCKTPEWTITNSTCHAEYTYHHYLACRNYEENSHKVTAHILNYVYSGISLLRDPPNQVRLLMSMQLVYIMKERFLKNGFKDLMN